MNTENSLGKLIPIKKTLPYTPFQDEIIFVDGTYTFKVETWRLEYCRDLLSEELKVDNNYTGSYVELILEVLKNPQLWTGFNEDEIAEIKNNIICSFDFRDYIIDWTQRDIKPSIFILHEAQENHYKFCQFELGERSLLDVLSEVIHAIDQKEHEDGKMYDSEKDDMLDLQVKIDRLEDIVRVCKQKMEELGIPFDVLDNITSGRRETPNLVISSKYNILINNQEVHMAPLDRAVYLLFLNHPEGINFSYLPDYREELLAIYRKLMNYRTSASMIKSVNDVTDPTQNSINEKCARIRKAFVAILGKYWAEPYTISGKRGDVKKITLDRSLIRDQEGSFHKKYVLEQIPLTSVETASTSAIQRAKQIATPFSEYHLFFDHEWYFINGKDCGNWWEVSFSKDDIMDESIPLCLCSDENGQTTIMFDFGDNGKFRLISFLGSRAIFVSDDGHIIAPASHRKMLSPYWSLDSAMQSGTIRRPSMEQESERSATCEISNHSDDDLPF